MRILFVGNANVAAAYTAERLYREGHSITWATSEEKENLWDGTYDGKIYRDGYEVSRLKRILELHEIDTVIFSYGNTGETEFAEHILESQIPALQNILKAVSVSKLKHFVYFSSAELWGKGGCTPSLAEQQYGETLCHYYEENSSLPLLILRPGMVYGRYALEEMGYPGYVLLNGIENTTVECPYSKEDYTDLIYGEDVAVAVNNLLELNHTGLYYVLTGHPVSFEEFHNTMSTLTGRKISVAYLGKQSAPDKAAYWEMSRKLKEDTGWMPFYLLEDKGKQVILDALEAHAEKVTDDWKEKEKKQGFRQWISEHTMLTAITETLVLFALMQIVLPFTEGAESMRYVDIRLLYVVLIAVAFGMRIGIVATVLAGISYARGLSAEGIDLTFLLYSVETWIPFIVYGITGAAAGYMSDKKTDEMDMANENYRNLMERYNFLKGLHKELLDVKGKLQKQITASHESFGKVYEIAGRLNSLSPDKVFFQAVNVVISTVGGCQAAIWLVNPDFMRFARKKAASAGLSGVLPNSMNLEEYPLLMEGFEKENLYVNRDLLEKYPDYAAPIYRRGKIIAFVAVYQLEAEKFTLYYQNLFKMVVGLIENSVVSALEHEEKRRNEIYLPGTELMNAKEFDIRLKLMEQEKESGNHTFLQLVVEHMEKWTLPELSGRLHKMIRENDFAGVDEEGNVRVVLDNAVQGDLEVIQKRFAGREVEVRLW